jgi:hypothetical protein
VGLLSHYKAAIGSFLPSLKFSSHWFFAFPIEEKSPAALRVSPYVAERALCRWKEHDE